MLILFKTFVNNIKSIFLICLIVLLLLILTYVNQNFIKDSFVQEEVLYENLLAKRVSENDVDNIDYNFLSEDLNSIDGILKEQLALNLDRNRKSKYYSVAEKIYSEKINELTRILNEKLDDEDFNRLQLDLDEFKTNIDYAVEDIKNTLESTVDIEYYTNKYIYEEKQKKCRELLETYKGFLQ